MKGIIQFTIAAFVLISSMVVQAQVPYLNSMQNYYDEVAQLKAKHPKVENKDRDRDFTFYLDYAIAAGDNNGFLSNMNTSYALPDDSALTYSAVVFDQIAGFTDPTSPSTSVVYWSDLGLPNSYPNLSITVDSIFWIGSQENNSGNMDYFTTSIVSVTGAGVPTSNVLWSQMDSTNVSYSSTGNWTGNGCLFQLGYAPDFIISIGQKIAVTVEYNDPSKLDTCGLVGTGIDLIPTGGDGVADSASVYKNSFYKITDIGNGAMGKNSELVYSNGSGAYLAQDWNIWILISFEYNPEYNIGISDVNENLSVSNLYPNPANANSNIHFFLGYSSKLEVNVVDVTGKMIQTIYNGSIAQGHHDMKVNTGNLLSGIYFVNMKADNGNTVTSKLVVAH